MVNKFVKIGDSFYKFSNFIPKGRMKEWTFGEWLEYKTALREYSLKSFSVTVPNKVKVSFSAESKYTRAIVFRLQCVLFGESDISYNSLSAEGLTEAIKNIPILKSDELELMEDSQIFTMIEDDNAEITINGTSEKIDFSNFKQVLRLYKALYPKYKANTRFHIETLSESEFKRLNKTVNN